MRAVSTTDVPWYLYPILLRPRQIAANLERVRRAGLVEEVPNLWQISLGVMRMWHRIVARPGSIGLAAQAPVRQSWRARFLKIRPLRFPFVLREGSVVPGDLSGLGSSPERLITHMLGTYHDGVQFAYDYQILQAYPGGPEKLRALARDVVSKDTPRNRWLRDLAIFDGYHERLLAFLDQAAIHGVQLPAGQADDPDIAFDAYLRWCASQPATPQATWLAVRRGLFSFPEGLSGDRASSPAAPAPAAAR